MIPPTQNKSQPTAIHNVSLENVYIKMVKATRIVNTPTWKTWTP